MAAYVATPSHEKTYPSAAPPGTSLIELLADTYSGAMLPVPAIHEATSFIYLEKIH